MAERRTLISSNKARVAAAKAGLAVEPVPVKPVPIEPVVSDCLNVASGAAAPTPIEIAVAREARRTAYRDELSQRFPEVFSRPDVPLAIGINHQIRAALPHGCKTRNAVLHAWTRTSCYLEAIAAGVQRRNIDGSPAGKPTEAERASACKRLAQLTAEVAQ